MSNLFREKSLRQISSPEELNAYIRVSVPSVWIVLAAVVVLLVGVCVWGIFGHMDTTLPAVAVSREGVVTAYVRADDAEKIVADAPVSIGDAAGKVVAMGKEPVRVDETFTEYMRHVGALQEGEWVYMLTLDVACEEGVHNAQIVIDSVSPLSFVLN